MSLWTENQRLIFDDVYAHPHSNAEEIAARVGRSVASVKGVLGMTRDRTIAEDAVALHNDAGEFVGMAPMPITDDRRWSADTAPLAWVDWRRVFDAEGKLWHPRYRWERHGDEKEYPQDVRPFYVEPLVQDRYPAIPGYGICQPGPGHHVCKRLGS